MAIFDCFPFFNELDVIEIRFRELYDVVDRFVLCESTLTHGGQPKPLYFQENRERFAPFLDKITALVCGNPSQKEPGQDMNWTRERNQRNFLTNGIGAAHSDDVIITTDADEIVSREKIEEIKNIDQGKLYTLEMQAYWYYANLTSDPKWTLGKAIRFGSLHSKFQGNLSYARNSGTEGCIFGAGWHLSYMGGYDRVKQKLQSFAHQEFNAEQYTNDRHIKDIVRFGTAAWDDFAATAPRGSTPYWRFVDPTTANAPRSVREKTCSPNLFLDAHFSTYDYDCGNLYHLRQLVRGFDGKPGLVLDIGGHEGRASYYLANALPNDTIYSSGTVSDRFERNMTSLTDGNFQVVSDLAALAHSTLKVVHINTSDNAQVLDFVMPKLAAQAIICGYGEGVAREKLGDIQTSGNFWWKAIG